MRHLEWTLALFMVAAFLAPLAAQEVEVADYAQREAVELEEFAGGNGGLVVLVVLLAAVIVLVAVILPW